jgi:hypothetical protein
MCKKQYLLLLEQIKEFETFFFKKNEDSFHKNIKEMTINIWLNK